MSGPFRACIGEALTKGEIDAEAAAIAEEAYDDAFASAEGLFGPAEADRFAADKVMAKLEAEKAEARRRTAMTIRARRTVLDHLAEFKALRGHTGMRELTGGDGKPPKGGWVQGGEPPKEGPGSKGATAAAFLERKIENMPGLSGAPGPSMGGRQRAIVGKAHAMMAQVIERFESKSGLNLTPRRAIETKLAGEAFGESTGDVAAKGMALAWYETAEMLRKAFNAAGGSIGKMDLWGLPTQWDPVRVRKVGRDAWVQIILPRVNRAKMIDRVTGQPFTDKRLEAVLGEVWQRIATGGAEARLRPGQPLGKGALAKRRGEERFLIFNSSKDWLAVQKAFGEGDVFQAMMGHIDAMATDIAQMQVFGPNPEAQFDWLANYARREAALEEAAGVEGAIKKAERAVRQAEMMKEHLTGSANVALRPTVARVSGDGRAVMSGLVLGTSILSEIPSAPYFGRMARAFSGLDRNGDMTELVRLLASPAERAIARRSGFIIEQATDGFVRGSHDSLRLMTVGDKSAAGLSAFARRLPAATLRASFLTPFVAARKRSFRFEFMGALHDVRDRTLAQLAKGDERDRTLADWFKARGFSEQDWAIMRATPAWEPRRGATYLRPSDVADTELGYRLAEGIDMETRFLTPESTLWTRAKLVGGAQTPPGTFKGETGRNWAMLRGFSVTASHLFAEEFALRGWKKAGNRWGAAGYVAVAAGSALTWLTIAGAVSIQTREILKGNDPLPMDLKFWGAASMQGGGFGIFGDFLYASQARNGKNAQITAMGPTGQAVADVWGATAGNATEIAADLGDGDSFGEAVEGADIGRDAAGLVRNYNPLATNWMTRAAYSRLVADQLQLLIDPEAEEQFARRARKMEREQHRGMWWEQGDLAPSRAPDVANAVRPED